MKLKDLKTAAAAKLAGVHADVTTYITALEAKASHNKYYAIGGLVVGGLIFWSIKRHMK